MTSPDLTVSADNLRRHAEDRLRKRLPVAQPQLSAQEILRHLQELQVHQIELELQNEELRTLRAQEEEARNRYLELYDFAPVSYVTLTKRGDVVQANLAAAALLKTEGAQLIGRNLSRCVIDADAAVFALFLRQVFDDKPHSQKSCEVTLAHHESTAVRHVLLQATLSPDGTECRAVMSDISSRKQAERYREEQLAITLHAVGDAVLATDEAGRITRLNQVAEKLIGKPSALVLGRLLSEVLNIVDAISRDRIESPILQVTRLENAIHANERSILIGADGPERNITLTASPIRDIQGQLLGSVVVIRDVTAQMHLEEQLRQAQNLKSLGKLAGGIAHDFNNMLTIILGAVEIIRINTHADPALDHPLQIMADTVARAGDLTRKLLGFARQGKQRDQPVDLHREIAALAELLRRTIDPCITIVTNSAAQSAIVRGDPTLLQNVLLNLCLNARDAMPEGGVLTISTGDLAGDSPEIRTHQLSAVDHLVITIADTGVGMSDTICTHLFEPFFTTKGPGKGTGLGLASVHGSVKEHHGAITVISSPRHGTSFRILLPTSHERELVEEIRRKDPVINLNGQTILIAEDEPALRELLAMRLESLGATVVQAENGDKALALFTANPTSFSLVILDQLMPGMHGTDVFHAIQKIRQGMRVLITSGFLGDGAISAIEHSGLAGFLPKPYTNADLIRLITVG